MLVTVVDGGGLREGGRESWKVIKIGDVDYHRRTHA